MKRILQIVLMGAGILITLFLCLFLHALTVTTQTFNQSAQTLNQSLSQTQQELAQINEEIHGTSQNLNAVLIQAGLTSDEVRRAATEQRVYWAKNSKETSTLINNLNNTVKDVDLVVMANGARFLTNQTSLAKSANDDLLSLNHSILQIGNVAEDLDRGVNHANQTLYTVDPQIEKVMTQVAQTSENINLATKSLAMASNDVQEKVHQLTRPASFAKSVGMTILDIASKVGSVMAGFVK